jgi:hypothetical protein
VRICIPNPARSRKKGTGASQSPATITPGRCDREKYWRKQATTDAAVRKNPSGW